MLADVAASKPGHPEETSEGARRARVTRFTGSAARPSEDRVAHEEPLEIQLGARALAVVMRTPGHDEELVLGFLVTERVVADARDVAAIRHCNRVPDPEAEENVVRVTLAEGVAVDFERLRRNLFASSSCGVCGKATIENALATAPPLDDASRVAAETLYALPDRLREGQAVFDETGGLHAAGLFDAEGELRVVREDVGRHNAVDKVIGWATRRDLLPLAGHVLMVSGRTSFEIVQKALAARIPVVAAVSAPSSLAVRLADASGLTLVGFLRGRALNLYGNRERVVG